MSVREHCWYHDEDRHPCNQKSDQPVAFLFILDTQKHDRNCHISEPQEVGYDKYLTERYICINFKVDLMHCNRSSLQLIKRYQVKCCIHCHDCQWSVLRYQLFSPLITAHYFLFHNIPPLLKHHVTIQYPHSYEHKSMQNLLHKWICACFHYAFSRSAQ